MRTFAVASLVAFASGHRVTVHKAATNAEAVVLEDEAATENATEVKDQGYGSSSRSASSEGSLMEEEAVDAEAEESEDQGLAEEEVEAYEEAEGDEAAEHDAEDEIVAAEEVTVDLEELQPVQPPKQYRLTQLESLSAFNGFRWPTVVPDLTPSENESLIFNVREHTKFGRGSEYSWEIAGRNRIPFRSPVLLGRLKSSAISNSFTFKSEAGHDDVFGLKKWRNMNPFSYEPTKFFFTSKDGKDVYYTIEKTFRQTHHHHLGGGGYHGGGYQGGGYQGGGYQASYHGGSYYHGHSKHQEYLNVYEGKCTKNCRNPIYTGSGHKKGLHFTFFRPGIDGPVCRVDREYARYGPLGRKDEFIMTVEANTDSALMMAAISLMDHLNNLEGD